MDFQATLALAVLCLSGWSALALLLDRRGPARINRRFAALILLFCIPQAYFYAQLVDPARDVFLLGLAAQAAIWLKGPLLLSVVRAAVDRPLSHEWRHYLAFPPALMAMVFTPQLWLEWGLAGFCSMFVYLVAALRDLRQARPRLALIHAAFPNSAWFWLLYVVAGMLVLVSVDMVFMGIAWVEGAFPVDFIRVTNWLVAGYFIVIAFLSVYRPALFFLEERLTEAEAPAQVAGPAREWRELDASLATTLAASLEDLMSREQLYRQQDLSLADLSGRLGISTHQASELLNLHFEQSFYEFLNSRRLRHAAKLLADAGRELRVIDIAFDAGFGNKNSFYRSFREAHGITPAQYRERALASGGELAPAATSVSQSQKPS